MDRSTIIKYPDFHQVERYVARNNKTFKIKDVKNYLKKAWSKWGLKIGDSAPTVRQPINVENKMFQTGPHHRWMCGFIRYKCNWFWFRFWIHQIRIGVGIKQRYLKKKRIKLLVFVVLFPPDLFIFFVPTFIIIL